MFSALSVSMTHFFVILAISQKVTTLAVITSESGNL